MGRRRADESARVEAFLAAARQAQVERQRADPAAEEPDHAGQGAAPTGPGRHRRESLAPPLLRLPREVARGRTGVASGAVLGVLLVAVVAAILFGGRVLLAERAARPTPVAASPMTGAGHDGATDGDAPEGLVARTQPVPTDAVTGGAGSTIPPAGAATGTGASAGSRGSPASLEVHVVGQVRRAGVVSLPAGARVADAVTAAGGARPGANLAALNLARVLADGEQILVPRPGEKVEACAVGAGAPASAAGGSGASGSGAAPGGSPPGGNGAPVNLNTADLATLDTLPGVGPVLAQRILDWRTQHGRFTNVAELGEVSGIGEKLMAQLTAKVTV